MWDRWDWYRSGFINQQTNKWKLLTKRQQICYPNYISHCTLTLHTLPLDIMLFYLYTHHVLDCAGYLARACKTLYRNPCKQPGVSDILTLPVLHHICVSIRKAGFILKGRGSSRRNCSAVLFLILLWFSQRIWLPQFYFVEILVCLFLLENIGFSELLVLTCFCFSLVF